MLARDRGRLVARRRGVAVPGAEEASVDRRAASRVDAACARGPARRAHASRERERDGSQRPRRRRHADADDARLQALGREARGEPGRRSARAERDDAHVGLGQLARAHLRRELARGLHVPHRARRRSSRRPGSSHAPAATRAPNDERHRRPRARPGRPAARARGRRAAPRATCGVAAAARAPPRPRARPASPKYVVASTWWLPAAPTVTTRFAPRARRLGEQALELADLVAAVDVVRQIVALDPEIATGRDSDATRITGVGYRPSCKAARRSRSVGRAISSRRADASGETRAKL